MTLSQIQQHRLGAKDQRKSNRIQSSLSRTITRKQVKELIGILTMAILVWVIGFTCLDKLDSNIYPGCKVIGQVGQTLVIKLDPEINTGTDAGYAACGDLIYKIALDGYNIKVVNKFWRKDIIDLKLARVMAMLNGAPATQEQIDQMNLDLDEAYTTIQAD